MSRFKDERPNFEAMSKEQLIAILDGFRRSLSCCEDVEGFCLGVGEKLNVSCQVGYYEDDEDED